MAEKLAELRKKGGGESGTIIPSTFGNSTAAYNTTVSLSVNVGDIVVITANMDVRNTLSGATVLNAKYNTDTRTWLLAYCKATSTTVSYTLTGGAQGAIFQIS